jgi:hypothetical protein
MNYFTPNEFSGWFDRMSQHQIDCLNKFRELWGEPVSVSPVEGAVGRHGGGSKSMHNIDRYGEVRATDVFPKGLTRDNLQRAYDCAKKAGFTGIGVYTEARPSIMLHLDTRDGNLAKWSAWRQKNKGWRYAGIEEAGLK